MRAITSLCFLLIAQTFRANGIPLTSAHDFGIYGGKTIKITEVPYMAIFRPNSDTWGCGASIVHEQFLITASHCTRRRQVNETSVTVGTDNINGGTKYEIEKWFHHPNYQASELDYDITVLKLKKKLVFSDRVKPIKMADSSLQLKEGDIVQTIGFGCTENNNELSKELLMVKLPYVGWEKCKSVMKEVTQRMICAGGEKGKSNCNGDSGGPLTYQDQLIGAVSWGTNPCALEGKPVVYGSVASMRDFIDDIIRKNA